MMSTNANCGKFYIISRQRVITCRSATYLTFKLLALKCFLNPKMYKLLVTPEKGEQPLRQGPGQRLFRFNCLVVVNHQLFCCGKDSYDPRWFRAYCKMDITELPFRVETKTNIGLLAECC
jgi:hypothetical protein